MPATCSTKRCCRFGFARGSYEARTDDGLELVDARIANAVSCVPPENKPTGVEITTCRRFLTAAIAEMPKLRAIVALGRIAHDSTVTALGAKRAAAPFGHGRKAEIGTVTCSAATTARATTPTPAC